MLYLADVTNYDPYTTNEEVRINNQYVDTIDEIHLDKCGSLLMDQRNFNGS